MTRYNRIPFIVLAVGLAFAVAGIGPALAGDARDGEHGTMHWVIVDDDGTRHERTIDMDGPRARLGVSLAGVADGGARVESVVEGSAAERAGLLAGDVVVSFDGRPVETPWDLTGAVLESRPGDRVAIEVLRDGARTTIDAELGEADGWGPAFAFGDGDFTFDLDGLHEQLAHLEELDGMQFSFDMDELHENLEQLREQLEDLDVDIDLDLGDLGDLGAGGHAWAFRSPRPRLGVELVAATDELREHLGSSGDRGVLVGRVRDDMPASGAGIEVGDLIVGVDGEPVEDAGDLRRLLAERDGATFGVDVIRDGAPLTLTVTLPAGRGEL